jgi:ribosomal protein L39E
MVAVAGGPTAVARGSACTVAARVTHPPAQIDTEGSETVSKLELEAWKHQNSRIPLLLLLKTRKKPQRNREKKEKEVPDNG